MRRPWAVAGVALATSACTSILGDFAVGGPGGGPSDAGGTRPAFDAGDDAASRLDATVGDASGDARNEGDAASPDAACAAGLTSCPGGCANLDDAATNCGACGVDCHGGGCAGMICGPYVVAQQPTTGTVAKLATDGTHVVWSDTGKATVEQIAATGGDAIALVPVSSTQGGVGSELALAASTVAFDYLGVVQPSVGLASLGVADSGVSVIPGTLATYGISLDTLATHVFYLNITGTQGALEDCPIDGLEADAAACATVAGGGQFLRQTASDATYLFFDQTGANSPAQAGLYLYTISTRTPSIFATDVAQSLALDGVWAYWTVATVSNDGGTTYAVRRTLEAAPGSVVQTPVGTMASSAFAVDGRSVYYWTGSAVTAAPASGGASTALAQASGFSQMAVGGGLLVWTDGATIWGLVLPPG